MTIRKKFATYVLAFTIVCGGVASLAAGPASAAPLASPAAAATFDDVSTTAATALAAIDTEQSASRLQAVASAVATRLGADPNRLYVAWTAADHAHQVALLSALTQVGVPYHRNSSKVGVAFDCSGLTAYAWGQSGLDLARHSTTQLRNAAARTIDTAHAGDLVYFPGHVMLWLGIDALVVHAPRPGHRVEVWQIGSRSVKSVKFADPTAP